MNLKRSKAFSLGFAIAAVATSANANIMSGDDRVKKLESIYAAIEKEVRPIDPVTLGKAPNPFAPDLGIKTEKKKEAAVVLSDEELLKQLSKYINPTGTFVFGGETYLVFKEKRAKVGSELKVTYNNKEYSVTISEINRLGYTIKYGDSELQLKLR